MSRTIHGQSTGALRHLRKKPAALAVYWCYVARMNNEGAAWPSSRGLQKDTGWNRDTCLEARQLLIDLCALEPIEEYTRPEWRKLSGLELVHRKNLDKSEYFRPTGYIVVNDKKTMLLYNGADDHNSIDEKSEQSADGGWRRPTTPSSNDAIRQNLIPYKELDSKKENPESAPVVADMVSDTEIPTTAEVIANPTTSGESHTTSNLAASNTEPDQSPPGSAPPPLSDNDAVVGLIKAWLDVSKTIQPKAYANKTIRAEALEMHQRGITAEQVNQFVTEKLAAKPTAPVWWGDITREIMLWLEPRKPKLQSSSDWYTPPDSPPVTAEDVAEYKAQFENLMAAKTIRMPHD